MIEKVKKILKSHLSKDFELLEYVDGKLYSKSRESSFVVTGDPASLKDLGVNSSEDTYYDIGKQTNGLVEMSGDYALPECFHFDLEITQNLHSMEYAGIVHNCNDFTQFAQFLHGTNCIINIAKHGKYIKQMFEFQTACYACKDRVVMHSKIFLDAKDPDRFMNVYLVLMQIEKSNIDYSESGELVI